MGIPANNGIKSAGIDYMDKPRNGFAVFSAAKNNACNLFGVGSFIINNFFKTAFCEFINI